jgi:hypothetical protein
MLTIKFATTSDVENIMVFIDKHWRKNHILSKDKKLFLYEYQAVKRINFVIAIDDNNEVFGALGFIKSSDDTDDIWAAMWKVIKHEKHPMLGIELLQYLIDSEDYNLLTCVGVNPNTIGIYTYLGIYTNHLDHYVMINKTIESFNILKVNNIDSLLKTPLIGKNEYTLKKINERQVDFDFEKREYIPHKDKKYFIKRYFNHPTYDYNVYGIFKGDLLSSLVVTREVSLGESRVLRVMDYLGDERDIVNISNYLYQLVVDNNNEYIDFMCFGFSNIILEKAGFLKINLESTEIIAPNYFAPFVQENIKINFMADTKEINKLRFCKADGDQDRPN